MAKSYRTLLNAARAMAAVAFVSAGPSFRHPLGAAMAGLWLYPTLRRNCRWHGPLVTHFQTEEKCVWLTIDDGPDLRCTPAFLDLLDGYQARASFFLIGRKVEAARTMCAEIVARGHGAENHTFSHPSGMWWLLPGSRVQNEIDACSHAIRVACGKAPQYFRSPVGMNGPFVHHAAGRAGLRIVGWSAAGGDGCVTAPSQVVEKILAQTRPGSILVLHSGDRVRHRLLTLRKLLDGLQSMGYSCVIPTAEQAS